MPATLSSAPLRPRKKSSTHGTSRSASSVGSPMTVRKTSVGKRIANSVTKSHCPRPTISATNRRPMSRAGPSARPTAAGENLGGGVEPMRNGGVASACVDGAGLGVV